MIYFLSDLHGNRELSGYRQYLEEDHSEDVLILLGDICLHYDCTEENKFFTSELLTLHTPICIVDGNHENFDYLESLPREEWNGGSVHRLTDHILHLERGNIYKIDGVTFFVLGGCAKSVTDHEIARAYENLRKYRFQVDYVLTHDYYKKRTGTAPRLSFEGLIDFIDNHVTYRQWYCGHHHVNRKLDEKHTVVYDQLTAVYKGV